MSISRRTNRALNRVLRDSLRARAHAEHPPEEAPAPTSAPAYTLCADIPDSYNDSYVRAIPKDPQNTFLYWELPKGHADGSLLADKGTAHVGNGEAIRIGEQLSKNQQRRQAEAETQTDNRNRENNGNVASNGRYDPSKEHPRREDFYHAEWDNGDRQPYYHQEENYRQINWDNRYQHNWDNGTAEQRLVTPAATEPARGTFANPQDLADFLEMAGQARHDGLQANWDNGSRYRHDECATDIIRIVNRYRHIGNQYGWDDGNQYRRHTENGAGTFDTAGLPYGGLNSLALHAQNPDCFQEFACQAGDDGFARSRHKPGSAAFSEMLEALIARCNQYISDYRERGGSPLACAMSSGLFSSANAERRS
jgi:hypothetical protein